LYGNKSEDEKTEKTLLVPEVKTMNEKNISTQFLPFNLIQTHPQLCFPLFYYPLYQILRFLKRTISLYSPVKNNYVFQQSFNLLKSSKPILTKPLFYNDKPSFCSDITKILKIKYKSINFWSLALKNSN